MPSDLIAPIFTLIGVVAGSGGTIINSLVQASRTSKDKMAESDVKVRLETRVAVIEEARKYVAALDGLISNLADYGSRLLEQHGARDEQDECDDDLRKEREKAKPDAMTLADLEGNRRVADREFDLADDRRAEAQRRLIASCKEVLAASSSCEIVAPEAIARLVKTLTERADLLQRIVSNNFWRDLTLTADVLHEQVFSDTRAAITSGIRNWMHAGTAPQQP